MFRILLRFWLAGGQRSIKSVWPVLVPLNIWHLHKPYIMPLSLRLPRFCMISLSFVGSIIHVQFGCSPSFFFFFFLSLRLCSVLLIAATTNMPIVEQPCCQLVGALFHPAVSIRFVLSNNFFCGKNVFWKVVSGWFVPEASSHCGSSNECGAIITACTHFSGKQWYLIIWISSSVDCSILNRVKAVITNPAYRDMVDLLRVGLGLGLGMLNYDRKWALES